MSVRGPWGWLRGNHVRKPISPAERFIDNILAVPVLLVMVPVMIVLDLTGRLK